MWATSEQGGTRVTALRGDKLIEHLDSRLSSYAVKNAWALNGDSRVHKEEPIANDTRTPFQHDRDRIIHSRAFRRLRGKTQVFIASKGDHYRTRLSHTLEVSQISRSVARVFGLNEDLTEAIALGHDLGHPPFGHSGERVLHKILSGQRPEILKLNIGGFKHNINSLKVVDYFERYFPEFPGLNLTHWTREGILKHTDLSFEGNGRVIDKVLDLSHLHIETDAPTSLEGQIVALCDEIAQVTHDLEDAFRAGVLKLEAEELRSVPVYIEAVERAGKTFDDYNRRMRVIRNLINILVTDLINGTEKRLDGVKRVSEPGGTIYSWFVCFSDEVSKQVRQLKHILADAVCASYEVSRMDIKGEMVIEKLFHAYVERPERLLDYAYRKYNDIKRATQPGEANYLNLRRPDVAKRAPELRQDDIFLRVVAEHIAGMTDNFAVQEYINLFIPASSGYYIDAPGGSST